MIFGAHFLLYSTDPVADRAFFRDALGFHAVEAVEEWLTGAPLSQPGPLAAPVA